MNRRKFLATGAAAAGLVAIGDIKAFAQAAAAELRPLPGERDSGGVDELERRRQRALEALRERRIDALASARPAARSSERAAE